MHFVRMRELGTPRLRVVRANQLVNFIPRCDTAG